jgi:hypothetical protein
LRGAVAKVIAKTQGANDVGTNKAGTK